MQRFRSFLIEKFGDNPAEAQFKIRFTNRMLLALLLPLLAEQFLGQLMGIMDTVMVSSVGDAAVSGVSLVDMIFVLFFNIFSALSTGGAVVASRAIGAGKAELARKSASALLLVSFIASFALMGIVFLFDEQIVTLLYGTIEQDVQAAAMTYMRVTLLSFPFVALSGAAGALFRSIGNSKISMYTSLAVNVLNVAGNAFFIFVTKWGVFGAALATLIGRVASALFLLIRLGEKKWTIHVDYKAMFHEKADRGLIRNILSVALPGSLESGTFQLGRILVLSIISTFGTAQITANAVAGNIDSLGVMPGFAFNLAIVTVVGQCVGADDWRAVKYYMDKMLRMSYVTFFAFNALLFACLPLLLEFYQVSPDARTLAVTLIFIHNGFALLLWTPSFVLPNGMKATGDAKFVMIVAVLSMFICRVFLSYILGIGFGMGAIGVWCAMVVDWIARVVCFEVRWKKKMRAMRVT